MVIGFKKYGQQGGATGFTGSAKTARRKRAGSVAVVLAFALIGAALTAPAASARPVAPSGATSTNNCVVALTPGKAKAASTNCYANFTEAISAASGGAIANAPANAADAVQDPNFRSQLDTSAGRLSGKAAAAPGVYSGYVLSIEYDLANYGGISLIFTGTAPCTASLGNVDYQYTIPSTSFWRDRISSFQTFSNAVCWVDHFYNYNYGLPHTGYTSSRASLPTLAGVNFNNNTRSLRWT